MSPEGIFILGACCAAFFHPSVRRNPQTQLFLAGIIILGILAALGVFSGPSHEDFGR
jgi:hypothetical protein